ncbi:MAG: adenine deaminase [Dehalogenimonas sp.]|uniref:Adenine deaminase n=1 Tax=Candidatus Dehalogenimonas loeffleri TaxID=3127115 RepID=A0ABZ2J2M2_9CHLR|nr:adenine deaminase [Dehalogenimonas sp.]
MSVNIEKLNRRIKVARREAPADLLLQNARVVNVFNGEIEKASVAICDGIIAGVGEYDAAAEIIDLEGRFLLPGFIDGHTHIESSMLDIGEYARAVTARGTTGLVTDLHELVNVTGIEGIRYILEASRHLPLDIKVMAPSCVPATHLESSGAVLDVDSVTDVLKMPGVIGLGEMMNFPGVLFGDSQVLGKVTAAADKIIDGHAPGVTGFDLNAYAGAGIGSDHESTRLAEASEKLARGLHIMIREGSTEKNLEELLPLVTAQTSRRCMFVVDDRSCADLKRDGDMDAIVRKAIRLGLDPVTAIQLATLNPAEYFGFKQVGAIAPGYRANLLVTDDLRVLDIKQVFFNGRLIANDGQALFEVTPKAPEALRRSMQVKPFDRKSLEPDLRDGPAPVIGLVPGQIVTRYLKEKITAIPDLNRDILKMVVVERHHGTGNIGIGLVKGFGLSGGALASSVAHDSHNIICVGTSDEEIQKAVQEVIRMGGGLTVVRDGKVLASLALPIAGLMSDRPLDEVVAGFEHLEAAALLTGVSAPAPFAALSFLALPVIPELKLTDLGLVDVGAFALIGKQV